jgi:hypothetical protein
LIKTSQNEDQSEDSAPSDGVISDEESTVYGGSPASEDDQSREETEAAQEGASHLAPLRAGNGTARKHSFATLRRASTASFRGPRGKTSDEENGLKSKQSKEFSEQGKVKWSVYGEYAKTSNLVAVVVYLALLAGAQTASVGTSAAIGSSLLLFEMTDANAMQVQTFGSNTGQK